MANSIHCVLSGVFKLGLYTYLQGQFSIYE